MFTTLDFHHSICTICTFLIPPHCSSHCSLKIQFHYIFTSHASTPSKMVCLPFSYQLKFHLQGKSELVKHTRTLNAIEGNLAFILSRWWNWSTPSLYMICSSSQSSLGRDSDRTLPTAWCLMSVCLFRICGNN